MTQLSDQAIKDWRNLILHKRGIRLTDDEAQTMALEWLEFYKLVYKPIEGNKNED